MKDVYVCIYIYIYIYIRIHTICTYIHTRTHLSLSLSLIGVFANQDSSKGGAVETGCSELYDVIYWFII